MEAWARTIPNVQFICVCVESKQVATSFHRMFNFQKVINGYIPSRGYMPRGYGQLGCSGFIVSDREGCFVSRKTAAYLDIGEAAFEYVESLLVPLIAAPIAKTTSANDKSSSKSKGDPKAKVEAPASVGVDSMDDEHKECTNSFNKVIQNPSKENMRELYGILKSHFDHEEEVMKKYFGNGTENGQHSSSSTAQPSSFSSLTSHMKDHQRMLSIASSELERVSSCSLPGK
mmetsp:Transcript_2287/g.3257  ORF Transcript_2287/g.3257 Transcript_2287/m.3257 type:complete len:230 (-) Transcript_2287:415-1104(-)